MGVRAGRLVISDDSQQLQTGTGSDGKEPDTEPNPVLRAFRKMRGDNNQKNLSTPDGVVVVVDQQGQTPSIQQHGAGVNNLTECPSSGSTPRTEHHQDVAAFR